jgi:quercetin dioxygenase-like cupin family protein
MKVVDFSRRLAEPVALFESVAASSVHLADGAGEAHVHCMYFEPGGRVGEHAAGFGQLLLVVEGEGWAAGQDGRPFPLSVGQAAYIARGEVHSKGSRTGMTVIMVQVRELEALARGVAAP